MPRPYSDDLRLRVVETVENAASRRQAAEFFKVTVSFVIKLLQRVQATGEVPPARFGGYEVSPLKAHEEDPRLWIAERSDITIAELQSRLSERGTKTSPAALARCHERLGLTRKKDAESRRAVARGHRHGRPGVGRPAARAEPGKPRLCRRNLDIHQHGAALRARAEGPTGRRRRATLRHDRITASCVFDGPIDGAAFKAPPPAHGGVHSMDRIIRLLTDDGQSRRWRRRSRPATSSSSTISAATRSPASGQPSRPGVPNSSTCRPTVPTSSHQRPEGV
jgi:transposase